MRIVATADTHFPFPDRRIPEGDIFFHAGDLMYTGYTDEWEKRVASLGALKDRFEELYYVPGNHDLHVEHYLGPSNQDLRRAGIKLLGTHPRFMTTKLRNGMIVLVYRMWSVFMAGRSIASKKV